MRLLIFITLFLTLTQAHNLHYIVKAPLFGTIGKVDINYNATNSSYDITANMKTSGFAKTLSGNRVEEYHSQGFVKNNRYNAQHFSQNVHYKKKHIKLQYIFNYRHNSIQKIKYKWKNNKLLNSTNHPLNYFATNDLFSAYHNIVQSLSLHPQNSRFSLLSAGLESFNGHLEIFIPSKAQQQKEAKQLRVNDVKIFHIVTHKNILGSKNGEIIFAVDNNGIAKAIRVLNTSFVSHIDAYLIN